MGVVSIVHTNSVVGWGLFHELTDQAATQPLARRSGPLSRFEGRVCGLFRELYCTPPLQIKAS